MILTIGLGVAALVAAVWGLSQRRARLALDVQLRAIREQLDAEARALLEAKQAIEQRDAQIERSREVAFEVAREHDAALEKLRSQAYQLRRSLASSGAEQDRLATALQAREAELLTAAAASAELEALRGRLEASQSELSRLRAEAGRSAPRAWIQRLGELERALESERLTRAELERRASDAEHALECLGSAAPSAEREALTRRVEELEGQLQRTSRERAAVASLGLPELPRDRRLLSGERRAVTEAVLRETYINTASAGAALLDARGSLWGRCGNSPVIERLAASATLLRSAPVAAALGQPPRLMSELYGVYGRHVVALPGLDLALAITSSRECPSLALRLAALRLVGPVEAPPALGVAPPPLALDPVASEQLDAWAVRRGALGVARFGPGEPAGTDSGFAAACAPIVPSVQNLFNRATRDGFGQGFVVQWRAEGDETLTARVLEDGLSVVFALFSSPPATRVVDDLVAHLRWARPALAVA